MKKGLPAIALLCGIVLNAQVLNLVPEPVSAQIKNGILTLTPSTAIVAANAETQQSAACINLYLKEYYGSRQTIKYQIFYHRKERVFLQKPINLSNG